MIGERLQELRKDRGISQAEIAKLLGVTHYTISSYECDRSDPDDNIKIILAKFFDVSLDYLLGLVDEQYSYRRDEKAIVIPHNFEDEDIKEVKEYISYIEFKKNKQ